MTAFARKNIRLDSHRYVGEALYFVTLCCSERRPIFADAARATRLIEIVQKHSFKHRFGVHAYCVMPDHLHCLVAGLESTSNLLAFVKNVKHTSSLAFGKNPDGFLWQKKFYDHILRPGESSDAVAGYIWMNPVRAGLCPDPREYPHSGSFTSDWKTIMRPLESWTLESWTPPWKPTQLRPDKMPPQNQPV